MSATRELIGSGGREIALDEVGRGRHFRIAPRRPWPLATVAPLQSGVAQQACHPFARTADAVVAQFGMDARCPVCPATPLVNRPDPRSKHAITLCACRCWSLPPGVIAAARNAEQSAQQGDRVIGLLRLDKREHR